MKTLYVEPGSPWENRYVESFYGNLLDEALDGEVFDSLLEANVLIGRWRKGDNTVRPRSSLGHRRPAAESRRPVSALVRIRLTKWTRAIPWQVYPGDRPWFNSWGQVNRAGSSPRPDRTIMADLLVARVEHWVGDLAVRLVSPGTILLVDLGGGVAYLGRGDFAPAEFLDHGLVLPGAGSLQLHLARSLRNPFWGGSHRTAFCSRRRIT